MGTSSISTMTRFKLGHYPPPGNGSSVFKRETLVSTRPQNPNQKAKRNPRRSNNSEQDDCEEHPIPPGVASGLLLLPDQQAVITSIRLPKDVEDIACYRYCS